MRAMRADIAQTWTIMEAFWGGDMPNVDRFSILPLPGAFSCFFFVSLLDRGKIWRSEDLDFSSSSIVLLGLTMLRGSVSEVVKHALGTCSGRKTF
jgi:hypothetical protein